MDFIKNIKNNSLLIIPNNIKEKVIEYISSLDRIIDVKILSLNELKKELLFNIDDESILFLMDKYNLKKEVAVEYLNNIYYVDNKSIKIPLIYGTTELKYSGLIHNLYQNLFLNKKEKDEGSNKNDNEIGNIQDLPKNKDNKENENKSSCNYPEVIIEPKNNININDNIIFNINKNDDKNIIKMNVENEKEENESRLLYFNDIIEFISDYLNILCDNEFLEFFNIKERYNYDEEGDFLDNYILNPEIDSLYFHLLFFDLLINILYSYTI